MQSPWLEYNGGRCPPYVAELGGRDKSVFANSFHFDGDREAVRKQSIRQALNNLLDLLVCD